MNSLLEKLLNWSKEDPLAPMQAIKVNDQWIMISVNQCVSNIEKLANYLKFIDLKRGDVAAIYAYNSPEWVQFDLALMLVGCSSAGIYTNSSPRTVHHILNHSEAKLLIVDTYDNYLKIVNESSLIQIAPSLQHIVILQDSMGDHNNSYELTSFSKAIEIGSKYHTKEFKDWLSEINLNERATIIYTSGTTGHSKGVCLSHRNLSYATECYARSWKAPHKGNLFSFLPLAHIAERITNLGIGIGNRYTVYFCSNPMSISSEMRDSKPTIALAVPRYWDKLKENMCKRLSHLSKGKQKLYIWSMSIGKKYWDYKLNNHQIPFVIKLSYFILNKICLQKIRQQLGLESSLRIVSGAAALSRSTLDWYRSIGIIIIEAYALSETSGILTCGISNQETISSVGVPYSGIEIRLSSEGEIETRGDHVFIEYFKDPQATQKMFKNGWLQTGDLGKIDERGNLQIIGRKREIIKTAEGKMVSPLYIESQLEKHPWIDLAIVIGNEKPYLTSLITLNDIGNKVNLSSSEKKEEIQKFINSLNSTLASHERIKKYRILTNHFSVEQEEITATMKIKRNKIEQNYQNHINSMY